MSCPMHADVAPAPLDAGAATVNDVFGDAKPMPDQKMQLPDSAAVSIIPKGGTSNEEDKWVFPSPQRFYNALRRKGWEPQERDMTAVVAIHNAVNEQAWKKVVEFEKIHESSCGSPKLLKIRGRPNDLSPKAQFMCFLYGYVKPFDRHDWIIDRCGTQVRYVIDFYRGPNLLHKLPDGNEFEQESIHLDVRPSATFANLKDRLLFFIKS